VNEPKTPAEKVAARHEARAQEWEARAKAAEAKALSLSEKYESLRVKAARDQEEKAKQLARYQELDNRETTRIELESALLAEHERCEALLSRLRDYESMEQDEDEERAQRDQYTFDLSQLEAEREARIKAELAQEQNSDIANRAAELEEELHVAMDQMESLEHEAAELKAILHKHDEDSREVDLDDLDERAKKFENDDEEEASTKT
jgi:hypothetical protein